MLAVPVAQRDEVENEEEFENCETWAIELSRDW